MSKIQFTIVSRVNEWGEIDKQRLLDDEGNEIFSVRNLDQTPEEAIIGRSLVGALDIVDAIQYGIQLAREQDIDSIELKYGDE